MIFRTCQEIHVDHQIRYSDGDIPELPLTNLGTIPFANPILMANRIRPCAHRLPSLNMSYFARTLLLTTSLSKLVNVAPNALVL
jgi:hypothetical protein